MHGDRRARGARKSNGNAFNGCGLFNLRGCLAMRGSAPRFARGKAHLHPASVWRTQFRPSPSSSLPSPSLLPCPSCVHLYSLTHGERGSSLAFVARAHISRVYSRTTPSVPAPSTLARCRPARPPPVYPSPFRASQLAATAPRFCYCLTIVPLLPQCVGPFV